MGELADFMVHEITVRTLTGSGGMGKTYAAPYTFNAWVVEKRQLVTGPGAEQIISDATIGDDEVGRANVYAPGSLVVLPSGRQAEVISCTKATSGGLGLPDHLEVFLT